MTTQRISGNCYGILSQGQLKVCNSTHYKANKTCPHRFDGSYKTESLGGKSCIFLATDDYARFSWPFLREKSETIDVFESLFLELQTIKEDIIGGAKAIKTDHRRKFDNKKFCNFLQYPCYMSSIFCSENTLAKRG